MQIVIIGTGNTATVLGKKLKAAGHSIVQVYGRNQQAAYALANTLDAKSCSVWEAITKDAELYIIALSDKALLNNEVLLPLKNQLIVHTAGAVPMAILKNISTNYGVLYPFQTIRKEIDPLPAIPLMIDANNTQSKEILQQLANTISEKVSIVNDTMRLKYHLCAVMANNFSNYLYTLNEDYCKKNGLDFSNLLPLIDETASRLHYFSPRSVQTGPGIRKDTSTIEQHLQLLKDEPGLKKLYSFFSNEIVRYPW